jgi:DNA-binding MarR family transcriptional regulator
MADRTEGLLELLHDVNRAMFEHVRAALPQQAAAPMAMGALRLLLMEPGLTVSEMARRARLAKSHVSQVVEHLRQEGFVEKRPDAEDHRLVRLFPTERAQSLHDEMRRRVREAFASIFAEIPEDALQALTAGLQELRDALDKASTRKRDEASS